MSKNSHGQRSDQLKRWMNFLNTQPRKIKDDRRRKQSYDKTQFLNK